VLKADTTDIDTPINPDVLFVHSGSLTVVWDDSALTLGKGDTMTLPLGLERQLSGDAVVYRIKGRA
jgi:mannose-6-phosphate isomerase-like protein (cupin superfamily)